MPGAGLGGYSLSEEVRFVIQRGEGAKLFDTRGHQYIDYVGGAGALILGHAHPLVIDAVKEQAGKGIHYFGTLNEQCILLAELLVKAIPCAEKIAYCTTGSEATFYAMRIARAYSGKDKVLKLEGAIMVITTILVFQSHPLDCQITRSVSRIRLECPLH